MSTSPRQKRVKPSPVPLADTSTFVLGLTEIITLRFEQPLWTLRVQSCGDGCHDRSRETHDDHGTPCQ